MMKESEKQTRPYRRFGIVRHTFPEMTRTEKAFVVAFVFCGLVAAIVARHSMRRPDEFAIAGLCGCVMVPVLCYWMRHEPAAILQILLFPFSGWSPNWPTIVLMCVRGFGIFCFFSCLFSFPLFFLPASWTNNRLVVLVLLAIAVGVSLRVLWKRRRSSDPGTLPEQAAS